MKETTSDRASWHVGMERASTTVQRDAPVNFWSASYFAPLDGLRVLSLVLVIGGHVRTVTPLHRYFSGGLAVGIFFVLSGFLITTLLLREESASGQISLTAFYIRRAFRILPPYFLTIAAYLLICQLPSQHALKVKVLNGLPYLLSLRNEYVPQGLAIAFTHSWSLSVEEKFYFLWPLLFFVLLRKPAARWAIVPVTCIPLLISPTHTLPVAYFSLLAGCCVAVALHAQRNRQRAVLDWADRAPMAAVIGIWILSYCASLSGTFRVSFVVCTALVLPILLLKQSWMAQMLGSPACAWMGKRTYSMYLVHQACLTPIEQRVIHPRTAMSFIAVVVLTYLVSLGLASVVYAVLERPAVSWGKRLAAAYTARQSSQSNRSEYEENVEIHPFPSA